MRFGVPKEIAETRVAITPDTVKALIKGGHSVLVERDAGHGSSIADGEYSAAGAEIVESAVAVFEKSDCILKVSPPTSAELERFRPEQGFIGMLGYRRNPAIVEELARRKVVAFAMDAIPRITRAQSMDALSSQATVAGYKAVLLAANHLPKFFPMLTTAAGTIRPAQGLILGAGVAGLQAIATARRLGAVVEAYDPRPVAKEQVLSLGATFVELGVQGEQDKYGYAKEMTAEMLERQKEVLHVRLKVADFVITTAQIPGKPAPRLITAEMVRDMKPGSVIIDLGAESGGNCELTRANETVVSHGVLILGPTGLPASMPLDSSRMYARNITALISDIVNDKGFTFDFANEVFRETCVTRKPPHQESTTT